MNAWKTLKNAIPKGMIRAVATRMRVSYDYASRWRRKPHSDEDPLSTGQASPLSRTCDLLDAVFLVNPSGAGLIVEHINLHYQLLINPRQSIAAFTGDRDRAQAACELLRSSTEAVCALNDEVLSSEALTQLQQLQLALHDTMLRVGRSLYYPSQSNKGNQNS